MSEVPSNFAPQGKKIIEAIIRERKIKASDFFSARHTVELMDARMEAARQMAEIGYSKRKIAGVIGRDRRTIRYYLTADMREKKRQRMRRCRALAAYPSEVADLVAAIAETKGVEVRSMVVAWVSERATMEAHSLAKVAA